MENNERLEYLPNIACIGFPKCATTFILRCFKEAGFNTLVNKEFPMHKLKDFQNEIKLAQEANQIVALKDPQTIYSTSLIQPLIQSDAKLIVCIRKPSRWLKSFYNYRLKKIEQGKKPSQFDKNVPSFSEIVHSNIQWWKISKARGRMARVIQNNILSEEFKKENLFFIIQEEFEMDHQRVLRELLEFLNAPSKTIVEKKRKLEFSRSDRYGFFREASYDEYLDDYYKEEMDHLSEIIHEYSAKNLWKIWNEYYQ